MNPNIILIVVLVLILGGAAAFLCLRLVLPLFFLPALAALASSLLLERVFRRYAPELEEEEQERDLGI